MSAQADPCPTCPGQEKLPPGYLEELIANKRSSGEPVVDDVCYARRLAACSSCPECLNGLLCRMCGCLVPYRAVDAQKSCPHTDGDRWA